jgi:hypothetical protein
MSDLVEGNDVGELFLSGSVEASAFLSLLRQEGKCGEVKKARPALAEGSGNLRDAKVVEGKWPGELFVKMDGGVDLAGELLQGVGRARSGRRHSAVRSDHAVFAGQNPGTDVVIRLGRSDARENGLFKLAIGVDVNGVLGGGDGRGSIFAKIEARLRDGLRGFPPCGAEVSLFTLTRLFAGGYQAQVFGPAEG